MHTPRHLPLLRPVLPLIVGILLCSAFPAAISLEVTVASFITGGIFLLFLKNKQHLFTPALLLIFTAFGYLYAQIHIPKFHANAFHHSADLQDTLLLKVNSPLEEKPNSYKATAEIAAHYKSGETRESKGNLLLYFSKSENLPKFGDEILVTAHVNEIEAPKNPGDFNFKKFMAGKHIYHSVYIPDENFKIISAANRFSLFREAHETREKLLIQLEKAFDNPDDFAVASALILGYKNDLSPEISQAYASAGAMHILAVSGLHVGIVYLMIMYFIKPLPRFKHKKIIIGLLILVGIWGYAFITGLSASVIRAATMLSFVAAGNMLSRNSNIYNTIAASCLFIIVVFGPFKILEVGMQLSYLAVLGIVYFQPKFASLYSPKTKAGTYLWNLMCVSVAAQLATGPLAVAVFGTFPNFFLISNLIVIPAAFLVLTTGMIYLFVSFWSEPAATFTGKVLALEFQGLNRAVTGIEQLPHSATHNINFTGTEALLIYAFVLSATAGLVFKKKAIIIAGGAILLFFGTYRITSKINRASNPKLIVYAEKDTKATLISGTDVQSIWGSDQVMRYTQRETTNQPADLANHLVVCDKKVIWRIDERLGFIPEKIDIHTLVIDGDAPVKTDKLIATKVAGQVVLGSETPYYKCRRWVKSLTKNKTRFHDVREKGAFTLPLAQVY